MIRRLRRTRNQQRIDALLTARGYKGDWFAYAVEVFGQSDGDYHRVQAAFAELGVVVRVETVRNWMTTRRNYESRKLRERSVA